MGELEEAGRSSVPRHGGPNTRQGSSKVTERRAGEVSAERMKEAEEKRSGSSGESGRMRNRDSRRRGEVDW